MEFYELIEIAIVTLCVMSVVVGSVWFFEKFGIKTGNSQTSAIFKFKNSGDILNMFRFLVLVGPIMEETFFRIIPSFAVDLAGIEGDAWTVGIIAAAVFALAHGISNDKGEKFVPIPQFIFGCLFWYMVRRYGPIGCIASHACVNFFVWAYLVGVYSLGIKKIE